MKKDGTDYFFPLLYINGRDSASLSSENSCWRPTGPSNVACA